MWIMVLAVVAFLLMCTLSNGLRPSNRIVVFRSKYSELYSTSIGSDALVRPEDENSPEFKEYLKALLQMQASRAKSGHASPSSGSADAYIAKLTRIKIERNARIKAGLPDVVTNTGYTEDDYKAALAEMQEPMVRDSPVGAEEVVAMGGKKVRALTKEELAALRAAEEAVARALAEKQTDPKSASQTLAPLPTSSYTPPAPAIRPNAPLPAKDIEVIESLIGGGKPRPSTARSAPSTPAPSTAARVQPKPASPTPVLSSSTPANSGQRDEIGTAPKYQPPSVTPPQFGETNGAPATVTSATPSKPIAPLPSSAVPSPNASLPEAIPLSAADKQKLSQAIGLLVKHRGGGPFGSGRLEGPEAEDMLRALDDAYAILQRDTRLALEKQRASPPPPAVVTSRSPPVSATPPALVKPKPTPVTPVKAERLERVDVPEGRSPDTDVVPLSPQQLAGLLDSIHANGVPPLLPQELVTLRDSLVRCLGAVQQVIDKNPNRQEQSSAATVRPVARPESQAPLKTASPPAPQTASLKDQLKYTLGLLLKHRGGPGFGHGRLAGGELETLQNNLLSVSQSLLEEAQAAAASSSVSY